MEFDDPLMQKRYNFLANIRPEELEERKRDGTLIAHLEAKAARCRKEAERLVRDGVTFDAQAESWAIRSVLLESPWD